MKIVVFSVALILSATAWAIEPVEDFHPLAAVHEEGGLCWVAWGDGSRYEGTPRIVYSNSKTQHATYKCKLDLVGGDPKIYYSQYETGNQPMYDVNGDTDAVCLTELDIAGEGGMWVSQCFYAESP